MHAAPALIWLKQGQAFPPAESAWRAHTEAPGLLAAGAQLDAALLESAYDQGIFPWFDAGQPVLWWCPDPRMLLAVKQFRLHTSLRKTLRKFMADPACEIRFDSDFKRVMLACAQIPRRGQKGTWIHRSVIEAYVALHAAGHAHSVETWIQGELAGGLYLVNRGGFVFGESMFAHRRDASKIALAALVGFCRAHSLPWIDCQQNTHHLASLGAREMSRTEFLDQLNRLRDRAPPVWQFEPVYWKQLTGLGTGGT